MEVLNQLRLSFRGRSGGSSSASSSTSVASGTSSGSRGSSSSLNSSGADSDTNNNSNSSSHCSAVMAKKRARQVCDLCGKRLLKLAGWRNYFTLPCRCRHAFCKQCITGRLQCRQKVLRSASFDLMWTFPCPGSAQCHQQLTVDFARGSSYSKNLVASDIESGDEDSWEREDDEDDLDDEEEEETDAGSDNVQDESDVSMCDGQDDSRLREIG